MSTPPGQPELMTPAEVAVAFRVDVTTVTRWADAGHIDCVRTLGGHRRYYAEQIRAIVNGEQAPVRTRAAEPEAQAAETPQAAAEPETPPADTPAPQLIAVLKCRDEVPIERRLPPGASYTCERHGAQTALRFRTAR